MLSVEYTAGIIDGEGSIYLYRSNRKNGHNYYRMVVNVANTNLEIIQLMYHSYGGRYRSHQRIGNRKLVYHWEIHSTDALKFLYRIKPFLIIKTKQAELAIRFQEHKEALLTGRTTIDYAFEEQCAIEMHSLNRKGYEKLGLDTTEKRMARDAESDFWRQFRCRSM